MSSPQGQVRYALMFDTTQAESGVKRFQTTLQQLGTNSTSVTRQIQGFTAGLNQNKSAFTANLNSVNQQGSALNNLSNYLKSNGIQVATLGSKVKDTMSKFAGFATGLSATASGVLQLGAGFRDYSDAQIGVERVTRKVSLAHEALGKATDKLTKLQHSGKASSKELAQAQLDVKQAQDQLNIQTQLLGESQERMFDSQTQFATAIIPTALGAIGTLGSAFKDLGLKGDKLTKAFKSLPSSLGVSKLGFIGMAGSIGVAAVAAEGLFDVLQRGVKLKALNDIIMQGNATIDQLNQQIAQLEGWKNTWYSQLKDLLFGGPVGRMITQQNSELADELITGIKTEIQRKSAAADFSKTLAMIWDTRDIPERLKPGLASAIDEIKAILVNPNNWKANEAKGFSLESVYDNSFKILQGKIATFGDNLREGFVIGLRNAQLEMVRLKPSLEGFTGETAKAGDAAYLASKNISVFTGETAKYAEAGEQTRIVIQNMDKEVKKLSVGLGVGGNIAVDFGNNVKDAIDKINAQKLQDFGSGIDKIIEAFKKFHKGKAPEFEIKFEKAKKEFDKFESEFAKKLGNMGPAGQKAAKDYVEKFVKEGVPKMPKAAQDMMKPIIDYAKAHKNDPPNLFIDGLLNVIGKAKQEVAKTAKNSLAGPLISSMKTAVTSIKGSTKEIQGFINNLHGKTIPIKLKISTEGGTGVGGNINANIRLGQHGLHEWVNKPTLFMAGEGGENERVDITPISKMSRSSGSSGGGGNNNTIIENHVHILDENIMRRFTARQGRNRYVFGA